MSRPRSDRAVVTTTGRAFGLDLEVAFPCPGLGGVPGRDGVRVERTTQRSLISDWPRRSTRLRRFGEQGAVPILTIDHHAESGYLFRYRGICWARVSVDGALVRCAPGRVGEGYWQRVLVSQILPFVSVLRGLEPMHASAACINGGAIAFVGGSGAGKSTLALSLVLRGGTFLSDDVLIATTDGDGSALAHPAFGMTNVRFETLNRLGPQAMALLGAPVDEDVEGVRVPIDIAHDSVPLRAMCFLVPRESAGEPVVERVEPWDPRLLLGATFNTVIDTPERLVRQLEMSASLSRAVPAFLLRRPADFEPERLIDSVLAGLEGVFA